MVAPKEPYKPPPEFEEVKDEPLVEETLSDTTELWLIQMPLNQFEPADFSGKEISVKLPEGEGWMGCVENSHGKSYDMYCLGNQGIQPLAFLPRSKTSMGVRKIARHICLLNANIKSDDASGGADHSVGNSGSRSQGSVKRKGMSQDQQRSVGSVSRKSSQVVSGITSEGREPSARKIGKSPETPTASYSRNLEESGAYDSSGRKVYRDGTNEVSEEPSSERKKKKRKSNSEV